MSASYKSSRLSPITVALGYGRKEQGEEKQINGNAAIQYGQNKNLKLDASLIKPNPLEYKLIVQLDLPSENHKSNKLTVSTKRSDNPRRVVSNLEFNSDGKVWVTDSEFVFSPVSPSFNVKSKCPEGKLSQIYVKLNHLSPKHFGGELKLINERKNFLLEGSVDSNAESVEDFLIKVNVHSPNLKLNKLSLEAQNKPSKSGRRIQITGKSGSNNILSGSTSYTAREENGKYIVEGSGSIKVKEETKSANFKYILQRLSLEKNGEQGIDISFDASLGNEAVDAEFKITNKQFRILNSYCEEKKQCAHIEIDSKTNSNDVHSYNHVLEIAIDLRKLGLSHEFGLKSVTNRANYALDHTVDIHFQSPENNKFQYSLYIHPGKAGFSLSTPKRTIALESTLNYNENKDKGVKVSSQVDFYLDKKNHADKKTSLTGWIEVDEKEEKFNGAFKFVEPGLSRPFSGSFTNDFSGSLTKGGYSSKLELDIFANANQKLIITLNGNIDSDKLESVDKLHIVSTGLGIDILATEEYRLDRSAYKSEYESKLIYKVGKSKFENILSSKISREKADILIRALNVDILKIAGKYSFNKDQQVIDTEISSYRKQPLVSHLEIKNYNTLKFNAAAKSKSIFQFYFEYLAKFLPYID